MNRLATTFLAAVFGLTASLAHSDTSPEADLAAMKLKAAGDPSLEMMMVQLGKSMPVNGRQMLLMQVLSQFPEARDGTFSKPIHYAIANMVREAQRRGQVVGQIYGADLNNDGLITKQEVQDTLTFVPQTAAADAFFTSDQNNDGVLQSDEVRNAASLHTDTRDDFDGTRANTLVLFDFDDDGYLTPEELDRAKKALGM